MPFQIHALAPAPFSALSYLSDAELAARNMTRVTADTVPGFPCRISLEDAPVGADLILLNYQHLDGPTPYAATHAIYVRDGADQAKPEVGEVPAMLTDRLLSVRGFDARGMMLDADVVDGPDLATVLDRFFANDTIAEAHIHFAKRGCFAAKATRSL